jgi:hypothetical protein
MRRGHETDSITILKAIGVVALAVVIATYILSRFDPISH